MANKKSRKRNRNTDVKAAAANDTTNVATESTPAAPIVELPKPEPVTAEQIATAVSARTAAIRRSQAGKFNKAVLTTIGGKEAPKFYPWTWQQRDAFMAGDSEAAKIVKARYLAHMEGVKA